MENSSPHPRSDDTLAPVEVLEVYDARVVPEPVYVGAWFPPPRRRRRVGLPLTLFLLTCLSTVLAGERLEFFLAALRAISLGQVNLGLAVIGQVLWEGLKYAVPVMTILICHEAGHFIQAWRYGVHASFPFFIPMPFSPLGTMGAVIAMEPRRGDRKALFDIGISGPLAGLVPTLIFCVIGMRSAHYDFPARGAEMYGDPLLFTILAGFLTDPPSAPGMDLILNPMLFAGWVGLLITSINLVPIGQLDGGHILYGLLRKKAHPIAWALLLGAAAAVGIAVVHFDIPDASVWIMMLMLVFLMNPAHPRTANDDVPLGFWRHVLGWATLAFLPLGFTPLPFVLR